MLVQQSNAPRIIDIHHHVYPPRYVAENLQRILARSDALEASMYSNWTPRAAVERMDRAGIASAINSMTSPGVWFADGEAARVRSRICNEFGAEMARDFPGRFGMFAAIPLPDTDGSLREIEHALDVLKLDGVGVLTSYAGKLIGDPAFSAVLDELNRRAAVVMVHPVMSCGNVTPGLLPATIEFPTDTARAVASLVFSGTFARCPGIRFIFPHGGGTLPSLVERIASAFQRLPPDERTAKLPHGLEHELRRHYYDVASVAKSRAGMAAVLELYSTSQLLYGSDEPFNSALEIVLELNKLGLSDRDAQAIQRDNALRLFPRLGAGDDVTEGDDADGSVAYPA
jgi:predicted TIM-barrel fold metal-dependent hydrolase